MRGYRENESGSRSFGVTREGKKDSIACVYIALAKKKKETSSSAERVGGGKEKGGGG